MKMLLRVGVAVATVGFAVPALAADVYVPPISDPIYTPGPMVTGDLTLGAAFLSASESCNGECKGSDEDWNYGEVFGSGRANIPLHGTWNLEVEAGGAGFFYDDGWSSSVFGVVGHAWTKLDSAALGVFAGVSFPGYGTYAPAVGAEGEAYFNNFTLGASGSYSWGGSDGYNFNAWNVTGWADYYFNPDLRIGGEVGYTSYGGDWYYPGATDWSFWADIEKRHTGTPFSGFLGVGYNSWSNDYYNGHEWGVVAGARILFDAPGSTLQGHNREVPWEAVSRLPVAWD